MARGLECHEIPIDFPKFGWFTCRSHTAGMTTDKSVEYGSAPVRSAAVKVPAVIGTVFWITKAATTAMGESTSDYLVHLLPPEVAVVLGAIGLVVALALQFSADHYVAWRYWLAVSMVGIFGTMAADVLHVGLDIPYVISTVFFAVVLAGIFTLWFRTEKTLSIHSIDSRRRELFYWAAVIATFALGTAAGDLTAVTVGLGYLSSAVLFAIVIVIPALAWSKFGMNPILAFWFAYIVTRPLGASVADWLGVSHERGGLDWGSGLVSIGLAVFIVCLVAYVTAVDRRRPNRV